MPLDKNAPVADWIHDFIKSDAPQFAGKSRKERIKMAVAAHIGAQNEEVELEEAQSMGDALRNSLSKPEPGSKLDRSIKNHNRAIKLGLPKDHPHIRQSAPDGHHFDKKGMIRLGEEVELEEAVTIEQLVDQFTEWCTDDLLENHELDDMVEFISTHKKPYKVGQSYIPATIIANPKLNYIRLSIGKKALQLISQSNNSYTLKTNRGNVTYPFGQHKGAILDTILFSSPTELSHFRSMMHMKFNDVIENVLSEEVELEELAKDTLIRYMDKVNQDTMKNDLDPTKRSFRKRNKSITGFSKAYRKVYMNDKTLDESADKQTHTDIFNRMVNDPSQRTKGDISGGHLMGTPENIARKVRAKIHKSMLKKSDGMSGADAAINTWHKEEVELEEASKQYHPEKSPYGMRHSVFAGREQRLKTVETWHKSPAAREKYANKVADSDGFHEFLGYHDPGNLKEGLESEHFDELKRHQQKGFKIRGSVNEVPHGSLSTEMKHDDGRSITVTTKRKDASGWEHVVESVELEEGNVAGGQLVGTWEHNPPKGYSGSKVADRLLVKHGSHYAIHADNDQYSQLHSGTLDQMMNKLKMTHKPKLPGVQKEAVELDEQFKKGDLVTTSNGMNGIVKGIRQTTKGTTVYDIHPHGDHKGKWGGNYVGWHNPADLKLREAVELEEAFDPHKTKHPNGGTVMTLVNPWKKDDQGRPELITHFAPNRNPGKIRKGRMKGYDVASTHDEAEAEKNKHEYAKKWGYHALQPLKEEQVNEVLDSSYLKKSFIAQVGKFIADASKPHGKKIKHSDTARRLFAKLNVGNHLAKIAEEYNLSEGKMGEIDDTVNSELDRHMTKHGAEFVGAHLHGFARKIAGTVSKKHNIPFDAAHDLVKRKFAE